MANRRMFSKNVVRTDKFLDMPMSSQNLYFHLGVEADDDGFISPKMIMRTIGCQEDDLKVLVTKGFVIPFKSGVVVITDWKENNWIQSDRYRPTLFQTEFKELDCIQNVYKLDTQVRLGKVRLGKDTKTSEETSQVNNLIDLFKDINPSYSKLFANKTQRGCAERLLKLHGYDKLKKLLNVIAQTNGDKYAPVITTPLQLEDKFGQLIAYGQKKQANSHPII